MRTLIRGSSPKAEVFTCANTPLVKWQQLVMEAFKQRNFDPGVIDKLTLRHGWEYGHSPMSFADREILRRARQARQDEAAKHPPYDYNS